MGSRISDVSHTVRDFLVTALLARDVRITRVSPRDADGRWDVDADVLVPDRTVNSLGLPLSKELLERQVYRVQLDDGLNIASYERRDPQDD